MDLKEQATELGIDFNDDTKEEDLKTMVDDKQAELKAEENKLKDVDYLKTELDKAIKKRDEAKGDRRRVQSKVEELEDKLEKMIDSTSVDSLKEELDELKKFKSDIEKEKEDADLKKKTEVERQSYQFEKQLKELRDEVEKERKSRNDEKDKLDQELVDTKQLIEELRVARLDADIITAASKHGALRPSQIVKILKGEFEYEKSLEKFVKKTYKENGKLADEISVDDYVKSFLEDEDNDNLVKADVKTTSLNTKKSDSDRTTTKQVVDGEYDPKDPKIVDAANFKGVSVEEHIRHLTLRDGKIGKSKAKSR